MFDLPLWIWLWIGFWVMVSFFSARQQLRDKTAEQERWEAGEPEQDERDAPVEEWSVVSKRLEIDEAEEHKDVDIHRLSSEPLTWPRTPASRTSLLAWMQDRANYLDWSPYHRCRPWRGRMILMVSALIQILIVLAIMNMPLDRLPGRLGIILGGLSLSAYGFVLVTGGRFARRHFSLLEGQLMWRSGARPILFLRAFQTDDESLTRVSDNASVDPARWVDWRSEEVLAKCVRRSRPFVTIGMPGEHLPNWGAGRIYLANGSRWTDAVKELTDIAELIIVRTSDSPSVAWELDYCLKTHPTKTVLFTVDDEGRPLNRSLYQRLQDVVRNHALYPLPQGAWRSWFLATCPDNEWTAYESTVHGREHAGLKSATAALVKDRINGASFIIDRYASFDYWLLQYGVLVTIGAYVLWHVLPRL